MAFLGAEHGLQGERASVAVAHGLNVAAPGLGSIGLAVVGHGLNCSAACGIFLDQPALAGGFFTIRKPFFLFF